MGGQWLQVLLEEVRTHFLHANFRDGDLQVILVVILRFYLGELS